MVDSVNREQNSSPPQLVIATAGHVDHGKTSLIRQLTGTDTDTLAEEKKRGLTINPGFAYHHFSDPAEESRQLALGFVDVPGHADFIHNMLAGVGSVQHALLVVACDDGIMPQTREHLAILNLLGIRNLTIALSKIDRCSTEQTEQVQAELDVLLLSDHFHEPQYFPVDNISGKGVAELKQHLETLALARAGSEEGDDAFATRFLIDRSFTVRGIGTVVTGTLRAGELRVDDRLILSANSQEVRVRGLQLDQQQLQRVGPGQRAAVNITANHDEINRGDWLAEADNFSPCYRMDVLLELLEDSTPLRQNTQYHLYLGASHHVVNLRNLSGKESIYQIRCPEPMHAHQGDRFILRDPAGRKTLGGGKVLDIFVPRKGRSEDKRIEELKIKSKDFQQALPLLLNHGPTGIDLHRFKVNYNLTTSASKNLLQKSDHDVVEIPVAGSSWPRLLSHSHFENLSQLIIETIESFHLENPQLQGISESSLSSALAFPGSHLLLSGLLNRLVEHSLLERSGTLLHLPGHQASLSAEEKEFLEKIHPVLEEHGRIPPRTRELVEITGIPLKPLERILKQCTRSGVLVQVAANRHFLPSTIAELAEFTEKLATQSGPDGGFSVIQFRDASGIGRNLCIEILEYFDRAGFTRRDENTRFIRTQKENIFG